MSDNSKMQRIIDDTEALLKEVPAYDNWERAILNREEERALNMKDYAMQSMNYGLPANLDEDQNRSDSENAFFFWSGEQALEVFEGMLDLGLVEGEITFDDTVDPRYGVGQYAIRVAPYVRETKTGVWLEALALVADVTSDQWGEEAEEAFEDMWAHGSQLLEFKKGGRKDRQKKAAKARKGAAAKAKRERSKEGAQQRNTQQPALVTKKGSQQAANRMGQEKADEKEAKGRKGKRAIGNPYHGATDINIPGRFSSKGAADTDDAGHGTDADNAGGSKNMKMTDAKGGVGKTTIPCGRRARTDGAPGMKTTRCWDGKPGHLDWGKGQKRRAEKKKAAAAAMFGR